MTEQNKTATDLALIYWGRELRRLRGEIEWAEYMVEVLKEEGS